MTSEFIFEEISMLFHSSSNLLPPPLYSSQLLHPPPKPPPNSSYLLLKGFRWLISSYMKRFWCYSAQKSFMGGGWWRHCNYSYKLQVQVSYRFEIDLGPGPELDNFCGFVRTKILVFDQNYVPVHVWKENIYRFHTFQVGVGVRTKYVNFFFDWDLPLFNEMHWDLWLQAWKTGLQKSRSYVI